MPANDPLLELMGAASLVTHIGYHWYRSPVNDVAMGT